MDWFAAGNCAEAGQFGWLVGAASGIYAASIVIVLIVTSPAYLAEVPRAVSERVRIIAQRLLKIAPLVLIAVWGICAIRVGRADIVCYATFVSLGTAGVIAPIMLLLMFTSANIVGSGSAR